MEYTEAKPEATPIQVDDLLHLGDRTAVARALSRLACSERMLRICRGVYMRPNPDQTRSQGTASGEGARFPFGILGRHHRPERGAAADWLGLTSQNTVRLVYLTSGPNRLLHFGAHPVELRHAPAWQLTAPHRTAGVVIRALAWLGPNEVEKGLDAVMPQLSGDDLSDLAAAQAVMRGWMAEPLSRRLTHG